MTLTQTITEMFAKRASSPAQRAVNAGSPNAAKDPTEGQKRVGNYRKVHLNLDGFRISIENPKGSYRSGTSPDGTKWRNMLACDYGDIRGTEGIDGDPVDIYLSDHPEKGAVFVIDQIDPKTKKFDEHKVMYGFDSIEDASKTYLACYQAGWKGLGWITPVTKAEFRKWIDSSDRKTKPFHEYKSVTPIVDPVKVAEDEKQAKWAKAVKATEAFVLHAKPNETLEEWRKTHNDDVTEKTAQVNENEFEGVPAGVKLRSFIDAPATRTAIMDNVLEAVKNRFPIEDDDVRLELRDVKYEGPTSYTLEQQKSALLGNRRLGCSLVGTWRLTDKKTGQVLDERRDGVLRVPYYTDRGTIINNGNEYTVISQARLSPGVYVRRKQNGELESQFNVANGLGFRIGLNRETGALNMSVGQGHVPLYPILRALGVSNEDIQKSWGREVAAVNVSQLEPRALDKVYARYAGRKADMNLSPVEKAKFVTEALSSSGLDPNVVVRTLGMENVTGVTGPVLLRAAQKLLNINRGAEDPDERDNPRFSKFYGVEDMMRERIDKDAGRLTKSILFRAKRDKSLARVGRNALAPYLDTFLSGSGLAMPGEEANPLSILTQQSRITRLGEGGISSPDLVTPEARNVQGDYLGYVDFISGPESFGIGIDVRAALGTMKGSDNRLYNKMVDLRTGRTRYVALDDAASHTVAFPGQDPKAPNLYVMRKGVPTLVPRDEVDYMVPGFGNTVSAGINMTPMPTAVQAGRQFYMSKFWEQYLPQKEGEVPLVDSLMDDGKTTYSEFYGRKVGCLTAPFAGTVIKANDKEIVIRGKDGQTHTTSLVQGLPFNRMTGITYISQVKKGDEIAQGGILANSNFTDAKTGAMNIGRNLKVAVLPAPLGVSSYEDAIVISESAAKKLATSRTYNFEQDTKEGTQIARNKYLAAFPKAYTKEQADTIDDNGVVKVGTVLHRDDPMILAIGPKMLSAEDAQLGKLSSVLRNALTDRSQKWEHDWPGVVTDVVAGAHGVKVLVKSEPPVKIGDKLCYDEETEVLTSRGWLHFRDVTLDDNVATLNPETFEFDYMKPSKVMSYDHDGEMYRIKSQLIDLLVTKNHNMFVKRRGHDKFELVPAENIYGKRVSYKKDAKWTGNDVEWFDFPPYTVGHRWGLITRPGVRMKMDTFLMLLGMYLSEGNSFDAGAKGSGIRIAQVKANPIHEAEKALKDAGVRFTYSGHQFHLSGRWLYNYFSKLGYSYEKYIPEFVFGLSARQQTILFNWMMWGDGHREHGMDISYTTSSKRLADDFQRLCLHIGRSSRVIHKGNPGDEHGSIDGRRIITKHDSYAIQIITSKLTPTVNHGHVHRQNIQEERFEHYSGKVYCCTMPKWHVIFVRRNGNVCWCGNSPENGLKGVVGGILPDDKMPRDAATNETYDMLMNPMGFLSRVAPGQVMLMNLAKVAKKTGKQIRIPQTPPPEGWLAWTERQMAENGVKETADVFDPQTGRTIRGVGDGYVYVKAFHHLAEKKFSARGIDGAYTQDEQPAKGGIDGAKRISGFDNLALLSHGATDVIKDSMTIRGQMNQDYWRRYRLGLPVEEPGVPFIYQKFINTLKAGGVNVVEKGDVTSIMPQTDADIDEMAQGRVIESSQMVDADMNPVKGGLFDLGTTGGMGGNRWSMIMLPEAVPNPMMEEPVRRVLGLTAKRLEAILSGREELDGKTGGEAIKAALAKVNIDESIERARTEIQNCRGSQRDNAVKVLGYLKAAKKMGKKPEDWMISRIPVLPPMFRPVAKMGDVALVPDMNELYKELIEMKHNYEDLAKELPASALADERLAVYGAVKAAYGLGDPITIEGQAKNLKGAIRQVIGTIPKFGMYQSKVISKTQDSVGRSVTIPDKNLDMDQIGIPEDMAWEMYKPHVERKLIQRGYAPIDARKMIDDKNATARHLLEDAMEERPVLMDRAPTWHKFNILAFHPHIVKGRSIHVCPLIDSGYNMDHDGDESRSPYITTLISDDFFKTLPIDLKSNECYNPCITKKVIEDRSMRKESVVINGKNVTGTVVSLKWDEFPHFDNPTINSHPNAHFYIVPDGVFVRSYDETNGEIVWAPVKYWSHHGVNEKLEIVTVELSSGRQILTDDDPRGVYGINPETMEFGRWRPSEAIGKFVPRCIKDDLPNYETKEISTGDYAGAEYSMKMPLDRTSGWFLGAMIGDGWDTQDKGRSVNICFCYDQAYNDIGNGFIDALRHSLCNGEDAHIGKVVHDKSENGRYGNAITLRYASSGAGRFVNAVIGHGAENKHLPPFWQKAPYEFRLGLFEGLMDTDGTLALVKAKAKKNVQLMSNFTSVSMTLATEVQYLCRTLGVDTKLTTQKTPAGGKCWQVSISTKNLKSLGLQLRSPHKAKALSEAEIRPETSVGGRKYMIPVPIRELKKVSSILLSLDKSAYVTFIRTSKNGYVPTTIADKIAKVLKAAPELQTELWKKWLELYSSIDKVVWERVEGFTNTGMFEDGYDLTVPGYETFMNSEGVILSNTVNIHVPASEKAAKQAFEKMLPSKNLFSLTDMKSVRYKPEKEQVSGLWALTRGRTRKPTRVFQTKAEATAAYRNGEIGPNDPVEIIELKG